MNNSSYKQNLKSLKEIYEEIANDKKRWSYYQNNTLSLNNAWKDKGSANKFIHEYFKNGGKEVFNLKSPIGSLGGSHERDIHTVSLYILGIYLSENLNWNKANTMCQRNFLFLWYLTCLYHDMGYKIEENVELVKAYGTLDKFMKEQEIDGETNLFKYIKKKELCKNYYRYIKATRGHIDHGITGA